MAEARDQTPEITVRAAGGPDDLRAIIAIRRAVFVLEQGVTTMVNSDPHDQSSYHIVGLVDGHIVGAGRLHVTGREGQIAWVAVLRDYRHLGVGRRIMRELIQIADQADARLTVLNAQVHALRFYEHLGFHPVGDTFIMGGILHQMMVRNAPSA